MPTWVYRVFPWRFSLPLALAATAALVTTCFAPTRLDVSSVFPHKPWAQTPVVFKAAQGAGLSAQDCARCHADHVADWKLSTHAHALQDLQFQAELAKASSPKWLCLNCHTPLGNQREELVRYLNKGNILEPIGEANAHFDAKLKQESVTCGVCHFRQNETGDTLIIAAKQNPSAPHPIFADPVGLRSRCLDCHNVSETVNAQLVCSFQTGDELAAGYLAGKQDCAGCHMRSVSENNAVARHRHSFIGGGVAKNYDLLIQQNKAGYVSALQFSLQDVKKASGGLTANLAVINSGTGHRVPTGDPERFIELRLSALDRRGKTLAEKVERIGQTWQWSPVARKVADNRLLPGEKREIPFALNAAAETDSIVLAVRHIRLTAENAQYMKQDAAHAEKPYAQKIAQIESHYPFSRVIYRETLKLSSGVRTIASAAELERLSAAQQGR